MSGILLDFVDGMVGRDAYAYASDDDEAITTELDSFWSATNETTADATAVADDDDTFCSAPTEIFEDFAAEEFSNTRTIQWMHSFPPRFNHTKDVMALIVGTEAQQKGACYTLLCYTLHTLPIVLRFVRMLWVAFVPFYELQRSHHISLPRPPFFFSLSVSLTLHIDYVLGLFAPAMAMLVFFLAWALALLIFKLLAPYANGSNATRWLGGQPLRMPSPPLGKDRADKYHYNAQKGETPEYQEWKREYTAARYKLFAFKSVIWVAGLSITIAALVMSVYGVDSLTNTLDAGRESINIAKSLAGDAQSIVESIISQNKDLSQKVYGMLEEVNGMCPLVKDPLCDNIYNISTCDITTFLGSDLNDVFQMAAGHFDAGEESEYFLEIVNAKNGLEDVQTVSSDMEHSAAQLNWALSLSMAMPLLLAMLCILILSGLLCPEVPKVLQCIRSRFMIPIFVVLVVFAYFFSLVFVTASIATADVCIYHNETDNIDERLTALLTRSKTIEELLGGKETQNLVVEFISFYIHQCPAEKLPSEILEQLNYVQTGVPVVQTFGAIVEDSTELIRDVCGFGEDQTQNLVDIADTLQGQMCSMVDILTDVRDFVQCGNWYPLYETTVYEALCYDGTRGFAYVASTQFVIVFMAFVVLTFRVAFFDIQVGDEFFDYVDDESGSDSYGSGSYYSNGSGSYYSTDSSEERGEMDTLEQGRFRYFKALRNKVGRRSLPPSSSSCAYSEEGLSETMEQMRSSHWQKQQTPVGRHADASFGRGSPEQQKQLQPSPPRNSIYPSRRFRRGETTVASPTRIDVLRNSSALECGENVIEVVEHFANRDANKTVVLNNNKNAKNGIIESPHSVGATSLWMKHQDNIEYVDSDADDYQRHDGTGYYSYGDDWSSRGDGDDDWYERGT
jgi:hypothetical protein